LEKDFPAVKIRRMPMDLEDMVSVKAAACELLKAPLDGLILNAGAYHIPRHKCDTGLDNVFQINFAAPYYLAKTLQPHLSSRGGKLVAVGSIAHNYSETDPEDVDFSTRSKHSLAYGNAKRFLMFSLYGLYEGKEGLAVVHPGITFTNITAHYPKVIFAIIKHPMKVIFMKPGRACLSILQGLVEDCDRNQWIGPKWFDIWGLPGKRVLKTCDEKEAAWICETAEEIYEGMK
jgi:NAD(P)-dependent dehydrogenase (short-subunit alcohol dehydrogenase family)